MDDPINRIDQDGNQGTLVVTVIGEMPPLPPLATMVLSGVLGGGGPMSSLAIIAAMGWTPQQAQPVSLEEARRRRWESLANIGVPVYLIGRNGAFNNDDQTDKIVNSLVAVRGRFMALEDCRKLFGFDSFEGVTEFLKTVSINNAETASLSLSAAERFVASISDAFVNDGKIYITNKGMEFQGNAFDQLLLHELYHLRCLLNTNEDATVLGPHVRADLLG